MGSIKNVFTELKIKTASQMVAILDRLPIGSLEINGKRWQINDSVTTAPFESGLERVELTKIMMAENTAAYCEYNLYVEDEATGVLILDK